MELKRWDYPEGSLVLGDCLKQMEQMKVDSVDLVFGSPPYSDCRTYLEDGEDLGISRNTEEWVEWMVEVFKASIRVCSGIVGFVVGHGKGVKTWDGAPVILCAELLRAGVNLRSPVWYKRYGIMGSGGNDWLRGDLEWIICAGPRDLPWSDNVACGSPPKWKAGGQISHRTVDGHRVNSEASKGNKYRGSYRNGKGRLTSVTTSDGKTELQSYIPPDISNPGNVIDCGAVGGGRLGSNISHDSEAPFPEKLPEFFIKSFCKPGGICFDPFGGSGTTLSMALQNGRKFLSCDLRMSQIKLMQRRLKQARHRKEFTLE